MTKINSKIGAHVSIAGGVDQAPARAAAQSCEVFQCFTRSPQGGKAPELTAELIASFKSQIIQHKIENFYIHTPYYINFASLNNVIRHSSSRVIREELERGSLLGAKYIMTHVGSHAGQTLQEGLARVITGIQRALDKYTGTTQFLIEISAGSGNVIGDTFDEIGEIVEQCKDLPGFGGVCFDTCHAFASGYDFRTKEGLKKVLSEFDEKIGLKWLKLTHVNDSQCELGGKKDRHEHIGDGHIGLDGMRNILTSGPFSAIDWILETDDSKRAQDVKKLQEIRNS